MVVRFSRNQRKTKECVHKTTSVRVGRGEFSFRPFVYIKCCHEILHGIQFARFRYRCNNFYDLSKKNVFQFFNKKKAKLILLNLRQCFVLTLFKATGKAMHSQFLGDILTIYEGYYILEYPYLGTGLEE
jgi:hypothetical protein